MLSSLGGGEGRTLRHEPGLQDVQGRRGYAGHTSGCGACGKRWERRGGDAQGGSGDAGRRRPGMWD